MADLVTFQELATWTQSDVAEVTEDPYAIEVLDKVSGLVRFLSGHAEWEIGTTPFDARLVALMVAKRAYGNPDQEVSTNTGPVGSRVLDVAAMLLELTDSERSTLTKYNPAGDPDGGSTGLYVISTTVGPQNILTEVLYVGDDQQVNLDSTNAAPEWMIPMFSPGDPGDPNAYPDA